MTISKLTEHLTNRMDSTRCQRIIDPVTQVDQFTKLLHPILAVRLFTGTSLSINPPLSHIRNIPHIPPILHIIRHLYRHNIIALKRRDPAMDAPRSRQLHRNINQENLHQSILLLLLRNGRSLIFPVQLGTPDRLQDHFQKKSVLSAIELHRPSQMSKSIRIRR